MTGSEVAKGHTNASATTRMTAAKDALSDKVDEKKHDVRYLPCLHFGQITDLFCRPSQMSTPTSRYALRYSGTHDLLIRARGSLFK